MHSDRFTVDDVLDELGDDGPSRRTVQRVLRAMRELGIVGHVPGSPLYRCNWSAVDAPDRTVDVTAALELLDLPGLTEEKQEKRAGAVREALLALEREGELSKSELLAEIDTLGGYESENSLWRNWLYEALSDLEEEGVTESPGNTSRGWRLAE